MGSGERLSGGCQCGALRYELTEAPDHATICHCRMCQKATGSAYYASATVRREALRWTRGVPAKFHSSSVALRGFCAACGTPLTWEWQDPEATTISVAIASLDTPDAVHPSRQIGIEARLSWWNGAGLDDGTTTAQDSAGLVAGLQNHQHPDHDTEAWPPAK